MARAMPAATGDARRRVRKLYWIQFGSCLARKRAAKAFGVAPAAPPR